MVTTTTHAPAVHHILTGHQLDQVCRVADLPGWVGHRGHHPVEEVLAPLAALRRFGRRLGVHTALALVGLSRTELERFFAGLGAVAPALHHNVVGGGLMLSDYDRGVLVVYLLGIEVVR